MTLVAAVSLALSAAALLSVVILSRAALCYLPHLACLPAPPARPAHNGPAALPVVSVIVPARNEEQRLPGCLAALARQDYPAYDVIVVDDESTDRTTAVARAVQRRHAHVRLVAGAPLPAGWVGKPWALHQAAAVARGEWLFFVDADAICTPDALRSVLGQALAHGLDALTLLPLQEVGTLWERAVQPAVFTLLLCGLDPARLTPPRDDRHTVANGQAFLIRRAVYEAVGGHAAVRGAIVEDFALARRLHACGWSLGWVDGRGLVRVRMYRSLAELWEGWTKNLLLPGLLSSVERQSLTFLTVLAGPLPYALLLLAGGRLVVGPATPLAWFVLALAVVAVGLLLRLQWGLRRVHTGGVTALLLHPLGATIVPVMAVAALWRHVRHAPTAWRGRRYQWGELHPTPVDGRLELTRATRARTPQEGP